MSNHENYSSAEAQFYKNIGFRIQYFRKLANLSQEELAEKCDLSPSTIGHIESTTPYIFSLKALYRIADALGIEPYKLLLFK